MRLALWRCREGAERADPNAIAYDLGAETAHGAPFAVAGDALVWTMAEDGTEDALLAAEVEPDVRAGWLLRCDRVDFVPGGVAWRHTHPGPGIRCVLRGEITVETAEGTRSYGPGEPWFERGPDPVLARTSAEEATSFVRVMLVPEALAGQRTLRLVDPADAERPRGQRATILLERPVAP